MATRIPALMVPPIGFAHRGARAHARENTLEAFALAREMGATGIETDAWITADGEVVLHHDGAVRGLPAMSRHLFGRPIARLARDQLPAHVPTLGEFYDACGTDLPLSVDVKDAAAFDRVVAVARLCGAAERLWLCHHDAEVLRGWRHQAPDVRLVHSTRLDRLSAPSPERHAADLAAAGIDAVNLRREEWNGGLTTLYHRFELFAFGWDAQQLRHIDELVEVGIDAVYSDHVDRMVQVLARFGRPRQDPGQLADPCRDNP